MDELKLVIEGYSVSVCPTAPVAGKPSEPRGKLTPQQWSAILAAIEALIMAFLGGGTEATTTGAHGDEKHTKKHAG